MVWMILGSPIFGNPYITWICVPGPPQKSKPDSLNRFPKSWMFHRENPQNHRPRTHRRVVALRAPQLLNALRCWHRLAQLLRIRAKQVLAEDDFNGHFRYRLIGGTVPTIYKAYVFGLCKGIYSPSFVGWLYMVQYLQFRNLKWPLMIYRCTEYQL